MEIVSKVGEPYTTRLYMAVTRISYDHWVM